MPRPTAAQLAYGSATVFFSTLAMLLLSQTQTGIGVAVIAIAGLGLGLLVAMTVPMPAVPRVVRRRAGRAESPAAPAASPAAAAPPAGVRPAHSPSRARRWHLADPAAAARARIGEHSG
ncbi:hypothetical protein GCM10012285_53220 [Streptomyces kronopolitis]|uniref:Membrane transport protein MMPL domain-containing protein n=1 Tax=Streptomyces kronopolitis TaxID=1612435 RepID=A0ABQ2JUH4_9ACTN|nr:hypothetical protein [Streptomyces kronopolitis]GGN57625.1 hypothetical protein GCM10012285_53220 [Streptomyces kronopolitis]